MLLIMIKFGAKVMIHLCM